ncbi:hypothetical protein PDE_05844 [Penicillium oxalicum 114-2]|uniref:Uncharacterized protein n=1 Tax=Penicillium oxalicum (strain 114-2 / CGMCC 5302) TaxID=933388 RepID=S7ZQI2_PENO1|nr:hypothetical protein PDE_05844 [Penicillium oxalicum 114-2]
MPPSLLQPHVCTVPFVKNPLLRHPPRSPGSTATLGLGTRPKTKCEPTFQRGKEKGQSAKIREDECHLAGHGLSVSTRRKKVETIAKWTNRQPPTVHSILPTPLVSDDLVVETHPANSTNKIGDSVDTSPR